MIDPLLRKHAKELCLCISLFACKNADIFPILLILTSTKLPEPNLKIDLKCQFRSTENCENSF